MNDEQFRDFLEKYQLGICTEEEQAWLESWYLQLNNQDKKNLPMAELESAGSNNWSVIWDRTKPNYNLFRLNVAAALVLLLFAVGFIFYIYQNQRIKETQKELANDIAPGGNKAFLTLSNGHKISLTDVESGQLAEQSGIKVTKTADGQIIYIIADAQAANNANNDQILYNTIETPIGGHYQVLLPDGSKVWLNAASSLKYPTSFLGTKTRQVNLTGEAYFEVSHNKAQPFTVLTAAISATGKPHLVEVLGTHFNINAYADEPFIKTTLLEGSVKINDLILKPGYKSEFDGERITISEADTEVETAWKNGDFIFNGQDLPAIIRMVSRWYNVEFEYPDNMKPMHFGGAVSRSKNISAVINMLQATGDVKFKIDGRRIIMIK